MTWKQGNIPLEENPLDRHIHLHIHEIIPERWLLPRRNRRGLFLGMFCGAVATIGIIGVLWIELWR